MALQAHWQRRSWLSRLLLPAALLFATLAAVRRGCYRCGALRSRSFAVPVVVVGNISVGGTGKTPVVIHLARRLTDQGLRVGIVSRGYGGSRAEAMSVSPESDPAVVGDEPMLIAREACVPVWVAARRTEALAGLLSAHDCDVVLSDDGLQHYAMARQVEIAVVDSERGLGNGWLLPAGPLREPPSRLTEVDLVLSNGDWPGADCRFSLRIRDVTNLVGGESRGLNSFAGATVHAVAGIGNPDRFFAQLRSGGLKLVEHAFPDHHTFAAHDLSFEDSRPVLMTAKDAVKCAGLADERFWVVRADVHDATDCITRRVMELLNR